jgi:hypothetical protein
MVAINQKATNEATKISSTEKTKKEELDIVIDCLKDIYID